MSNFRFFDNPFDNATAKSFKKAIILSNYHDAALNERKAIDPRYVSLYDRYHLLHMALVNEYNSWHSASGKQQGQTLSLKQQFDLNYAKVDDWDLAIQIVHRKDTPAYKSIFPDGRKPFIRSNIDNRINAFDTLSKNIGSDAALAAVKAEVDASFALLDGIRDSQEGAKGNVKDGSGLVNTARIAAMAMQYRNLGFVMDTFYETREKECNIIFDLATLRQSDQSTFNRSIMPGATAEILVHTFLPDDTFKAKIDSTGPIRLFLASSPGGTDSKEVVIGGLAEVTVNISDFKVDSVAGHRFLTALSGADSVTKLKVVLE